MARVTNTPGNSAASRSDHWTPSARTPSPAEKPPHDHRSLDRPGRRRPLPPARPAQGPRRQRPAPHPRPARHRRRRTPSPSTPPPARSPTNTVRRLPVRAKLTRWGIDLHTGVLFGLVNQIALALLAFALILQIVWGYRMWW
ncbi:PepSY domain-containing protein [Streptomyces yokosukanensis]|uniref:PepSY domain-containing protein n=1 Tax=Streptomyces yokosukanensis TaxID=67386 RepID=UPI00342CD8DA